MKTIYCPEIPRTYRNNGQHAQQRFEFAVLHTISKADNKPHSLCGDVLHYQVKSARASVCKGLDLIAYLAEDAATEYAYVTAEGIAYIMSKAEYIEFCENFAKPAKESTKKNGGGDKLRLGHETVALLNYLAERA